MIQLVLAFRSFLYRKKQYASLFFICLFGTSISLFSLFLSSGMISSLNEKAEVYYGGELVFMSSHRDERRIVNLKKTCEIVKSLLPKDAVMTVRYDFSSESKTCFYYEGEEVYQRVIKGVNFDEEKYLFSKLNFLAGNFDIPKGSNKILLSEAIAKKLGVSVGDEITLYLRTTVGYINTVPLVVQGIFLDSSVFGMFTTYMDLQFLLSTYGRSTDYANRICIEFPERKRISSKMIVSLHEELKKHFKMYPLVDDKRTFYFSGCSQDTYALIPLKANLNDVKILKSAMTVVISTVIAFLILIIVAGIGSTYQVLVMKRINEIGVYMALGMKKKAIMQSIMLETLFLLISGCLSGFVFSLILCKIVSSVKFTFIPAFSIFLSKGYIQPAITPLALFSIHFAIIVVTLVAVYFSVKKSVNIMPCRAISSNE